MNTSSSYRRQSIMRSAIFTILVPGAVAGLVPCLLTDGWHRAGDLLGLSGTRVGGAALVVLGLPVLLGAIYKFATDGLGTPAPHIPTRNLVVTGPHRYVRNPMYLAVVAIIVGQAFLLGQATLLWYAAFVALATALFVYVYEQPTLTKKFGDEYLRYRAAVPAWFPRVTPYRPSVRPGRATR